MAGAAPAFAQTARPAATSATPQTTTTSQTVTPDAVQLNPLTPINLERIKRAVNQAPSIKLDGVQLRYYVKVVAKQPRFSDYFGDFDLMKGPVPGAGMTYNEFMGQVTPRQLYGSGGFKATEMLTNALVNLAGQAIIKSGLKAIRDARTQSQINAIRARIDRELAALLGKGD